jgi:excisionase family DNA binding protein
VTIGGRRSGEAIPRIASQMVGCEVQGMEARTTRMFMTVDEAAERLGVTRGWIYERTRRKAIPHRKLGKFVRFTEDDLQAISEAAARGTLQ